MANNSAHDQRLKDADKKFKAWAKRMREQGYVVRGSNAFKRTEDKTSPSGYRDKRVASFSGSTKTEKQTPVYSTAEKGKNPINRSHGGAGADWSKLMSTKKKDEPQTNSEVRTLTNNNSGGGGGGGDRTPTPTPPRPNSSPTPPRRNGIGQRTPLSGGAGGTRPTGPAPKPKSRLEKALSGIGKWEAPKEKPKRNKPTSRFLKKTGNTRRK